MDTPVVSRFGVPDLGVGVGYRIPHYRFVVERRPAMDFFEVLSENFLVDGGSPLYFLERLAAIYRIVPHGVSLSVGSDPEPGYLDRLRGLLDHLNPPWWSDHLCFTGVVGRRVHDLLPLPYTKETIRHVSDRIKRAQDHTGRLFAVENVSSYLSYRDSVMPEEEFLACVADTADCAILLDVNNVHVSAHNHGFDPHTYLATVPSDRVVQIHLAGHTAKDEGYLLDTHDRPVSAAVWDLYREAIRRVGSVSTVIERDDDIPPFESLAAEASLARSHRDAVLEEGARAAG